MGERDRSIIWACRCYRTVSRGLKEKQHCPIQCRKLLPLLFLLNVGDTGGGEWSYTRGEVKAGWTGRCEAGAAASPQLAYEPSSACPAQLPSLTTVGTNRNGRMIILRVPRVCLLPGVSALQIAACRGTRYCKIPFRDPLILCDLVELGTSNAWVSLILTNALALAQSVAIIIALLCAVRELSKNLSDTQVTPNSSIRLWLNSAGALLFLLCSIGSFIVLGKKIMGATWVGSDQPPRVWFRMPSASRNASWSALLQLTEHCKLENYKLNHSFTGNADFTVTLT